jgi:hypothetical protein
MGLHAFAMSRFAGVWTRHEDHPGGGGVVVVGAGRPRAREDHPARGFPDAARRPAHALARRAAGAGGAPVRLQVVRGAGLRARQQAQPQRHRGAERPLRHHRQRQGLQRHAPGAGRPGPGRRHLPRGWASACTRSTWCGRWRPPSRATSRRACRRSWSSRRSARSSNTRSRKSSTTGARRAPNVLGKFDDDDGGSGGEWSMPNPSQNWLLRAKADLTPAIIAKAIAKRLKKLGVDADIARAWTSAWPWSTRASAAGAGPPGGDRSPGSAAAARTTPAPACPRARARWPASAATSWPCGWTAAPVTFSQMGGEGVSPGSARRPSATTSTSSPTWATAPTSTAACLAVRQSIAAKVNITYKILYNDAVAMTGGQPVDGTLRVLQIMTRELDAEGAKQIVIVTDEPLKYDGRGAGARRHRAPPRRARPVQRELREIPAAPS